MGGAGVGRGGAEGNVGSIGLELLAGNARLLEHELSNVDGSAMASGHGDGVAGSAVEVERGAVGSPEEDAADEGPALEAVDVDLDHAGVELLEDAIEEVVGQGGARSGGGRAAS